MQENIKHPVFKLKLQLKKFYVKMMSCLDIYLNKKKCLETKNNVEYRILLYFTLRTLYNVNSILVNLFGEDNVSTKLHMFNAF